MLKKYYAFVFLAVTGLISCSKDDKTTVTPQTIVDIQVIDEFGSDLPGVEVSLYTSQLDWAKEQNPVQLATTTSNGVAKFLYLTDSVYYINAVSGNQSNWESNFRISGIQDGKSHFATIKLGNHKSSMISSAEGRSWRVHAYKINGVDVTGDTIHNCITDNIWVFYKGDRSGRFERHENTLSCVTDAPAVESGSWQIPAQSDSLKLPENGQVVGYSLNHLSPTAIRIGRQQGTDLIEYTLTNQ